MRLGVGSSSSGAAAVVLWWLTATTNTPMTSEAFSSGSSSSSSTRVGSTTTRTRVASAVDTPSVSALEEEDDDALHRKNAIRRKFGLPSLTRDEFLELQEEVSQMEREHEAKVVEQRRRQAASESKKKGSNLLSTVFGSVLEDTCQDNGDCESPQVCCDFVVKKMCCSSGEKSRNFWEESVTQSQLQPILMPVPVSNGEY